ncbi:MAG TPA: NUDIX domain-containing protein [Ornithinibacter sp.]|nr:NUDIX domain-containing protein [Ornithinibacter sp.]
MTRVPDQAVVTAYRHLRADAVRVLEGWQAPDADQERLRRSYLDRLTVEPDAVARAGPPAHLTASCVVLDPSGGQVLLTLHRKAHAWFQFGGHLEAGDPSVWAAARREAREESGIDTLEPLPLPVQLDRHALTGSFGTCREHLDVRYVAVAPAGARSRVSEESHDVRWWPVAALPEGTRAELGPLVSLARDALGLG